MGLKLTGQALRQVKPPMRPRHADMVVPPEWPCHRRDRITGVAAPLESLEKEIEGVDDGLSLLLDRSHPFAEDGAFKHISEGQPLFSNAYLKDLVG
ncbi:MAG: hypothetical protein OEU92_23125 [Alphaproteobacteria bacterium]|nr:hypothetical protein [Alphaproteobacteria bacterium]